MGFVQNCSWQRCREVVYLVVIAVAVVVIAVAVVLIMILVAMFGSADEKNRELEGKLARAHMKNIHLEEENKRLSNAKEEADEHITLLKGFIIFMFIIIIAMILGRQHKN